MKIERKSNAMIVIQDNTIRDGMQQTKVKKSVATKRLVIKELSQTKVNSAEISMCNTEQDISILSEYMGILRNEQKGVILTRLLESSIDLGLKLRRRFPNVVLKLLIPVSKLHIREKLKTSEDIYLQKISNILKYLRKRHVVVDVCLEDATRADGEFLFKVLDLISNFKVGYITLADTVGCSTPVEYGQLFRSVASKYPKLRLSAHCHNDLGLATANTIAAIENGASQVETTFLGIGERAGNTAIDEVVAVLSKKKIDKTGLDLQTVYKVSNNIKDILNYEISPTKPVLGKNVFVHESGIHQDGTMKNPSMYQFLLPMELGIPNSTSYTVSGISSKKILYKYFEEIADQSIDIDELIVFYRQLSKVTDKLTPEDCLEIYMLGETNTHENINRKRKLI